jgi:hypothetical protein
MQMELTIKFDETELGYVDDYLSGEGYRRVVEDTLGYIRKRLKHDALNKFEECTLEHIQAHILESLRNKVPGGVERLL